LIEKNLSGVGWNKANDHVEAGGLARPVRTKKPSDFATLDAQ
jgi:hypothetical protein